MVPRCAYMEGESQHDEPSGFDELVLVLKVSWAIEGMSLLRVHPLSD